MKSKPNLEDQLSAKVQEVLDCLLAKDNYKRQMESLKEIAETLSVKLGKLLIELKAIYTKIYGESPETPFARWAAEKFERAEVTIHKYMQRSRNPEKYVASQKVHAENKRREYADGSALSKVKAAFVKLSADDKREFAAWMDSRFKLETAKILAPVRRKASAAHARAA